MHDGIVRSIDSGKVSALVLLDLSLAFDTVDHDIMLQVMKNRFNVEGKALDWYRSYLTDRTQTFQVGSTQSGPHIIDCSVPQGSVLGPQEFIAYVEDLSQLIDSYHVDHHQYADDTQIAAHTSIEDVPATVDRLQKCVEAARAWCASRRLQLNSLKTELIWFGTRGSLCKLSNTMTCLRVGGDVIKPAAVVRNLGVLLDSEMSMKQHIEQVVSTCFYQLRRLRQVRRLIGQHSTVSLVNAFVTSRLDYCNGCTRGATRVRNCTVATGPECSC